MALDLTGRTAVVTGSSKGIGFSIAEALARANANVIVSARNAAEVAEAARQLEGAGGGKVLGIPCDVGRLEDVRRLIGATAEQLGGVDILVNNAGFGIFSPVDQIDPAEWDRLIATNLSGVFYCCHEAIPHLKNSKDAWIINIASLAGKNPFAGGTAYNASKFGLVGFSEALMMDVRQHGIRVNYIMPGSVNTYFNDNEPDESGAWKIQPEDIAQVVMDLLALPSNSLVSRVEMRPARPPKH
ncbi:SDR family oxidoreductase [Longimicrobium sp.]|uniref:SDR family oxidoreductase n=1 Tax=Longimicrobium sp. TaxID=2029185 RepID=UPI002C9BE96F|nr:SDR family oxidoreductase [Longimicrobium sp.]HSU15073.1 SDR family oxidoreductase [Longimicrobium sp.]